MTETPTLDPADPIDAVLLEIHELNRRKRADYAVDGDPFSNFYAVARRVSHLGIGPMGVLEVLLAVKEERLIALAVNGRDPANESVDDTYLDKTVYAVLQRALALRLGQEATP